jgi:hypothetical protein
MRNYWQFYGELCVGIYKYYTNDDGGVSFDTFTNHGLPVTYGRVSSAQSLEKAYQYDKGARRDLYIDVDSVDDFIVLTNKKKLVQKLIK